jgi:hypothetical protein
MFMADLLIDNRVVGNAEQSRVTLHSRLKTLAGLFLFFLVALSGFQASAQKLPARKDKAFTEYFRQTNDWDAGDGAISLALSDGRVLWLFGDSYIDQLDAATGTLPCLFNARNAVLVQDPKDPAHFHTLRNPSGERSFLRPPEAAKGAPWPCFWPGAGFQSGSNIYIYVMEMESNGQGGTLGFKGVGQSWAKLSCPELKVTGYTKMPEQNGISFGCGFFNDETSGMTYAYGNKGSGLGSDVYVARFPTKNPEGAWTFWNGSAWIANVTNATAIGRGASFAVGVAKVNGKFLLTTSAFSVAADQGKDIFVSAADRPTGPFSPLRKIFSVDDTVQGHYPFFYSVFAHPEFINAAHELLITYSINGYEPAVPTCVKGRMQPDYYRPRAIRVPLKAIGLEP